MQHGAASASEKASSTSGAVSVCSRSDDDRVPMKGLMNESEEAWPTLGQSQEQSAKKKVKGSGTPRDGRSSMERSRKSRSSRGVPLSREEQDKLFHHEKPERLYKERRDKAGEKEKTHQRRHSIQSELRPLQPAKTQKEQSDTEATPGQPPTGNTSQTPRETNSRSFQGGRGRGRVAGRGRFGRGRGHHRPSHSYDPAYFAAMPPSAGVPPMYPAVPFLHPMYYPAVPAYPVMPHVPGMMYPPPGALPAVPMPGFSRQQFVEAAKKQIEYYFSEENLDRDIFLRSKMDGDGWIPLHVIMSFNRLRNLTMDQHLILEALYSSEVVELSEDLSLLRAKEHEKWVLPEDEQKLSHVPAVHYPYVPATVAFSDPNQQDNVFQFDEEKAQRGSGAGLSDEQDEFVDPDLDRLIVVIQGQGGGHSRGTIMDGRMAAAINEGLAHYQQHLQPSTNRNAREEPRHHFFSSSLPKNSSRMSRKSLDEGHSRPSPSVGWILGSASHQRHSNGTTQEGLQLDMMLPDLDHPGLAHLKAGNFVQVYYNKFYSRCIKDRNAKGFGKSEEMRTLYRFWCYFLRNNFNARMYADFKKFSFEDGEEGERYGIECLFNFFCYGLEQNFNEDLYADFEDITLRDYNGGSLYGLEKFWAFHHYGGIPQESDAHVDPRLAELIEQYPTLDSLRRKTEPKSASKESYHHCTSPSSTLSSAAEPMAMDRHMSSVPEAENVMSVQNESLSVA